MPISCCFNYIALQYALKSCNVMPIVQFIFALVSFDSHDWFLRHFFFVDFSNAFKNIIDLDLHGFANHQCKGNILTFFIVEFGLCKPYGKLVKHYNNASCSFCPCCMAALQKR